MFCVLRMHTGLRATTPVLLIYAHKTLKMIFFKGELKRIRMLRDLIERDEINIVITGAIVPVHRGHDDEHLFCPKYRYGQFRTTHVSTQICEESEI